MDQVQELLGITSGIFALAAAVPYIHSILKDQTKPERAAYFIWGLTSTISFLAYRADGAQESVWFAFGDFLVGVVMFMLAIKYGYGWVKGRDTLGIIVALFGIALWIVTDEPFLALLFSVGVDAVGSVLVAIKSYEAPDTEHLGSWLIYLVGAILALFSVGELNYALLFYPAYAVISTAAIVMSIMAGRKLHSD